MKDARAMRVYFAGESSIFGEMEIGTLMSEI